MNSQQRRKKRRAAVKKALDSLIKELSGQGATQLQIDEAVKERKEQLANGTA